MIINKVQMYENFRAAQNLFRTNLNKFFKQQLQCPL